ncbi:hypothetical protein HaLaN_06340 [Haematococcus lacustris]|uniref:Uncharacterized protein n=1 Tax=Haematococcus lacustris TaxID=44745 RepID=A0A699YVS2_HAELA|nr:hypothetical protein HaLaN_06340 [Haematococcus lacustris]
MKCDVAWHRVAADSEPGQGAPVHRVRVEVEPGCFLDLLSTQAAPPVSMHLLACTGRSCPCWPSCPGCRPGDHQWQP